MLHGGAEDGNLTLPKACGVTQWQVVWDAADADPTSSDAAAGEVLKSGATRRAKGSSMLALTPVT